MEVGLHPGAPDHEMEEVLDAGIIAAVSVARERRPAGKEGVANQSTEENEEQCLKCQT